METLRTALQAITFRIQNNCEKQQNIRAQQVAYEKAKKENDTSYRLYTLVSGQTRNGKITFEQYIQAAGFDSILQAANRHLLPMSDNQFQLYRQTNAVGKQTNYISGSGGAGYQHRKNAARLEICQAAKV